jgi:acetolactate synthase-1/2/3 large subunit
MPTVADLIVEGLLRAEVSRLFGVPGGGSNLEVLEAARSRGLPFVLCHQEWAACIMAAVTGELTGHPGAVLSTLGPGVTASATGLAHARLDRSPLIYVSDRHPASVLEYTTHQYLDHAAHVGPITKGSVTVGADSAAHWVAHAVQLALAEPRGPVHLDLPADVAGRSAMPVATSVTPAPPAALDGDLLERAAAMIRAARRPIVIAGLGCRAADAKWLRAFAEALPTPVLTTYKGKGAIPDPHPLALGIFTGGALEEPLVSRADLIITFGLDTVELIPRRWPYAAPVLSLTRAAAEDPRLRAPGGDAYFRPALEVVGEPGAILEDLAPRIMGRGASADWDVVEVDRMRRERLAALEIPVPGLAPHRVAQMTRELTPAGGLATMGFALPAAIAAQLVHPDRRVVCFTGDGGLMMVAAELETVARLRLPLLIVVFNDEALSLIGIKQEQKGFEGVSMRYRGPDLVALARAFGLRAFTATDEPTLERALIGAQTAPGPALIDARIDPSGYRRMLEIVRGAPR